ncbi:MAG: hypothetical protein ACK421_08625 [Pseudanabaenaceae cyanobacterium]
MAFNSFKQLSDAIRELGSSYEKANFIQPLQFNLPDYFIEDRQFVMKEGVVNNSEYALCENLIYPLLQEVRKKYSATLTLWSHQYLAYINLISDFSGYVVARRSPRGKIVFDRPYIIIVEAKKDDFDGGWEECLAEMVAANKLNQESVTVYGIVSNSYTWEFAKLRNQMFVKNLIAYSIFHLEQLVSVVHYVSQMAN